MVMYLFKISCIWCGQALKTQNRRATLLSRTGSMGNDQPKAVALIS